MVQATDFLLDPATGDLVLEAGDLVTGPSDFQHIEHLLLAYPGYYREAPLAGVGLPAYYKSSGAAPEVQRLISVQLEADNYQVLTNQVTYKPNGTLVPTLNTARIR